MTKLKNKQRFYLNAVGTVLAITALAILMSLRSNVGELAIQGNHRLFYKTNMVTLLPVESLQAIILTSNILFALYYGYLSYESWKRKQGQVSLSRLSAIDPVQSRQLNNGESRDSERILAKSSQKDFSNMLIGYLFLFLIEGLSIIVSIFLYIVAISRIQDIMDRYNPEITQADSRSSFTYAINLARAALAMDAVLLLKLGYLFYRDVNSFNSSS